MKRLLSIITAILIFQLAIGPAAWGANMVAAVDVAGTSVKYKAGDLSNCNDSTGWTTGKDLDEALASAGMGYTLSICAGSYSGTQLDASDGIDTVNNNQTITGAGSGLVTIDCSGLNDYCLVIAHATTTVSGVTITGSDSGKYNVYATAAHVLNDVNLIGGDRTYYTQANFTLNRVIIADNESTSYNAYINGAAIAGAINYSIIRDNVASALYVNAVGTLNITNTIFAGNKFRALQFPAGYAGATVIKNSVLIANQWGDGNNEVIDNDSSSGGTVTLSSSIALPNPNAPTTKFLNGVTLAEPDTNVYKSPRFVTPNKPCYVAVGVDDGTNYSYFNDLATQANIYGVKAYFAFSGTAENHLDAAFWDATWSALQTHVANGHEVVSHTNYSDDLTAEGDHGAQQLADSKSIIETKIGSGYSCTSVAYPGGAYDADVVTAAISAGYTLGRTTAVNTFTLSSQEIYEMRGLSAPAAFGTTAATIARNAYSFFEYLNHVGGVAFLYSHDDFTGEQWGYVVEALSKSNCTSATPKEIDAYIRTGETADGGLTWTRTLTAQKTYLLQSSSPAINAGTVVSGVHPGTDFAGNPNLRGAAPDIGAYEKSLGGLFQQFNKTNRFAPFRRLH